ncbi:MAG: hypothetical protein JW723_00920 [Bacteroidales bacterium]|nr:hypothetical protein [Bacteroidales bacterium]
MKPVVIYFLLILCGFPLRSQTDRLDSLLHDVLGDDKEMIRFLAPLPSYCYLYSVFSGDNKTSYAGREIGDNMYSMNGSIYFFHSKGFFVGTTGSWYSQLDPGYSNTIFSAGFFKALNPKKNLTFRASYNRYFYNNTDTEITNVFNNNLGAGLTLRNKWIGGRFSFNFLFGQDFGMNIMPNVFSRITIARFGKYNMIQFEPEFSLFIGSEIVEYTSAGSLTGQQSDSQSSSPAKDVYGLLNTQFYFPLLIYAGDFDIELGYSVNIPHSQDESIEYPVNSFFSVSLGYLLPLN